MICIYDKKTTKGNFETNGLGVLDEVISCFITQELNGDYELELEYSAKGRKAKYLEKWNIIKVIVPEEAEIIKRIYREYLEGSTWTKLKKDLKEMGYLQVQVKKDGILVQFQRYSGKKSIVWRCVSRLEKTGLACNSRTVLEDLLNNAVVKAINDLLGEKDDFLQVLSNNIETVINEQDTNTATEIEKKLEELQKQLLIRANSKEEYNDIADKIYRLREEKHNALVESAEREVLKQRIRQMTEFLNEQLVRRLIEKVMVHDERFEVEFKSGMSMEVER